MNTNRNAFQKIYDELKYLCKIATTGSKEEKALLKAKKIFDDVYSKGETNSVEGVKYAVKRIGDIIYVKSEKNIFVKEDGTLASEKDIFNSLVGKTISLPDGDVKIVKRLPQKDMYNELSRRYPKQLGNIKNVRQLNSDVNYNMEELLENSELKTPNETDKGGKHQAQGINSFDTRKVVFYDGSNAYNIEFSIANLQNGEKIAYAKKYFGYNKKLTKKIQSAEVRSNQSPLNQRSVKEGLTPSNTIIRNSAEKSTGKFSLSSIAPETSPNGTLKITSDDVTLKAPTKKVGTESDVANREVLPDNIDKFQDTDYNIKRGEQYARTDEFRNLQAESQRMSVEDTQLYWTGSKQLDDGLRQRLSRSVKHIFLESFGNGRGNDSRLLKLSAKGKQYSLYENVNGSLFHDVFEIARKHLRNGELVDLHTVETALKEDLLTRPLPWYTEISLWQFMKK